MASAGMEPEREPAEGRAPRSPGPLGAVRRTVRWALARFRRWSEVHTRRQVEMLAPEPPEE